MDCAFYVIQYLVEKNKKKLKEINIIIIFPICSQPKFLN